MYTALSFYDSINFKQNNHNRFKQVVARSVFFISTFEKRKRKKPGAAQM